MKKSLRLVNSGQSDPKNVDNTFGGPIRLLFRSDMVWLGRSIVRILGWTWRNRFIQPEVTSKNQPLLPCGPFVTTRQNQVGDLLLWVPRRMESYIIDDLTGGYGYSHATVDTGEIDVPTQKPVMIEILQGGTVMRKFQDQYPHRPFARIPISRTGVNAAQFVECVKTKLGEPYDNLEVITLGKIHNPAREVCSGLVGDCLPDKERNLIAMAKRKGLLRRGAVSINSKPGVNENKEAVSPNGFAEYYGAPKGRTLCGPDTLIDPRPVRMSGWSPRLWQVPAGILASTVAVFIVFHVTFRNTEIQHASQKLAN